MKSGVFIYLFFCTRTSLLFCCDSAMKSICFFLFLFFYQDTAATFLFFQRDCATKTVCFSLRHCSISFLLLASDVVNTCCFSPRHHCFSCHEKHCFIPGHCCIYCRYSAMKSVVFFNLKYCCVFCQDSATKSGCFY